MKKMARFAAGALAAAISASTLAGNGVQVNIDNGNGQNITGDAANEPTLAISPLDPDVMVIGWREFPTTSSDSRFAGFAHSVDGGVTWTNGGQLDPPPNQPNNAEQTDPLLAVDSDGTFYYWSEVFRPNPPTTHYVYKSFNGGVSWEIPAQVQNPPTPGDKEWMAIDRTGGRGNGHVYGGWNNFNLGGHCFVRSIDGGRTFSAPVRIADAGGTQWMIQYAVGPDGEVYAAWRNYSQNRIFITKSTNADDPDATPVFNAFGGGGQNGADLIIDNSNDPGFIALNPVGFHQIYLDVDRSEGPRRGHVYCLWSDDRNDVADIYFARSEDGGFTWQTGIRVNDDTLGAYQWMPAMCVAPDGRIDAFWYDTRDDSANFRSSLYYSFSNDGGQTWKPNRRLSDSFDTTVGVPVQQKIGDYIQCVSLTESACLAYAATFNNEQDIYFIRTFPEVVADLADFAIVEGTLLAGSLDDLLESDDSHVRARSAIGLSAFEPNVMEIIVGALTTLQTPTSINLVIESRLNNPNGTAKVRLRNWTTNQFEQVAVYAVGTMEETVELEEIDAANRVREADGRIDLSVRQVVIATFSPIGFESFFDLTRIGVE